MYRMFRVGRASDKHVMEGSVEHRQRICIAQTRFLLYSCVSFLNSVFGEFGFLKIVYMHFFLPRINIPNTDLGKLDFKSKRSRSQALVW